MKITIYELLGMIKDHEEPKKIKYRNNIFEYIGGFGDYKPDDIAKYHGNYLFHYLFEEEVNFLNDEVEILEEPKGIPEKICTNRIINTKDILEFEMIQNKINAEYTYAINSIIDYLKSKGE